MKLTTILSILALILSVNSYGKSTFLDDEKLGQCGTNSSSTIELRKADNGDLSVQLNGVNTDRCDHIKFFDATSDKTIKSYKIKGTSYTLSQSQRDALSDDCKVGVRLYGRYHETYYITLGWWCTGSTPKKVAQSSYSFQLSNKGNCKLMVYGNYSQKNVDKAYCDGAVSKKDIITYEFSNKGNCKRMKNGKYTQVNVADSYCTTKLD